MLNRVLEIYNKISELVDEGSLRLVEPFADQLDQDNIQRFKRAIPACLFAIEPTDYEKEDYDYNEIINIGLYIFYRNKQSKHNQFFNALELCERVINKAKEIKGHKTITQLEPISNSPEATIFRIGIKYKRSL